jgi:HD-like signal output (HDOD) protein
MKRILFVDDEPAVLDGLRDIVHRQRRLWETSFAPDGKAALEELGRAPFDVVVADMRMPGMDGAELLGQVKEHYPTVARLVLSGHADQLTLARALPVAQQYLTKPCDGDVLLRVIDRVCDLQGLVAGTAVRDIVGRMDRLPAIPATYFNLTRSIDDPGTRTDEIARIVQSDPVMSARVLQLVNSAYFGLDRPLSSVAHAISYIGLDLLKGLALTLDVFAATKRRTPAGLSFEKVQQRSILTARLAKQMLRDPVEAETAFTAGLVHGVGTIILALTIPDRFAEVVRRVRDTGVATHHIERELLGATHAEVGGYLLGVWGLPLPIVEAVAYHHALPATQRGRMDAALAVHVGDALAGRALSGRDLPLDIDRDALDAAGVSHELPRWRDLAAREARSILERSERSQRQAAEM